MIFHLNSGKLQVLTVATRNTEALDRYLRTARLNNLNVKVLGLGQEWTGGDMKGPGGGQKINLLKESYLLSVGCDMRMAARTKQPEVFNSTQISRMVNKTS